MDNSISVPINVKCIMINYLFINENSTAKQSHFSDDKVTDIDAKNI